MKPVSKILSQSFIKQFYKENAGTFIFIFTMMFFIVAKVDGAALYEYHYSLVSGILKSYIFLLLVFFIWFIYVRKFVMFVSGVMQNPQYSFLGIYNQLSRARRLRLFFMVEVRLLLPVLLYSVFIVFVGCKQHLYTPVIISVVYLFLLIILATAWHVYSLDNSYKHVSFSLRKITRKLSLPSNYITAIIRFVFSHQPILFTGIKVFTCGMLYLISRNNTPEDIDITMPFLFYNFGLLANGVLIFRIRTFEEMYLGFYKSLPVPLIKRLLQYALLFFILFIPEFVTAITLTPEHLSLQYAIDFMLYGYSLLLLMNTITFLYDFKMKDYLKVLLAIFAVEYIFIVTVGFLFLYLLFFVLSVAVFLKQYYKFKRIV